MSVTPPYQYLAKQFLDMWQEQLATMMTDKEFIAATLEMLQNMPTSFNDGAGIYSAQGNEKKRKTTTEGASVPPGAGELAMAVLQQRVEACERRIAALEYAAAAARPKRKKPVSSGDRAGSKTKISKTPSRRK